MNMWRTSAKNCADRGRSGMGNEKGQRARMMCVGGIGENCTDWVWGCMGKEMQRRIWGAIVKNCNDRDWGNMGKELQGRICGEIDKKL